MERKTYCFKCKKYVITKEAAAVCPDCGYKLIEVIRSIITGNDIRDYEAE